MKGIVLAGGRGTRLHPITKVVSKSLLPVYDKPMVYYPLSTLMLTGIREILLISTPRDVSLYRDLLGDGKELGIHLEYATQSSPDGIAEAFCIGSEFIGDSEVALILGDNIFYGQGMSRLLRKARKDHRGATAFGYPVQDPHRYGVVVFDEVGTPSKVIEKPENPASNVAITGLYYFDSDVTEKASDLQPSNRGELEITSLLSQYCQTDDLSLVRLGRGAAWFDAGTPQSLLEAVNFIATIERRQGLKVACLEEVAWRMGFIDTTQLEELAQKKVGRERTYLESLILDPEGLHTSSING